MAATNDKLDEVLFELMQLNLYVRDMLVAERAERPAPIIEVSSPDVDLTPLASVLQPVNLEPLMAKLDSLRAQPADSPATIEALAALKKEISDLGASMRAIAGSSLTGGGGAVHLDPNSSLEVSNTSANPVPVSGAVTTDGLTDAQLRAAPIEVTDSAEREYTHVVATVTASGNTTIHTPASGNAIRLRWIYVMTDPTSTSVPLVKVSLGASEKYRIYGGLQKRQVTTGAVDDALIVNLSSTGNVVVTAVLEEI